MLPDTRGAAQDALATTRAAGEGPGAVQHGSELNDSQAAGRLLECQAVQGLCQLLEHHVTVLEQSQEPVGCMLHAEDSDAGVPSFAFPFPRHMTEHTLCTGLDTAGLLWSCRANSFGSYAYIYICDSITTVAICNMLTTIWIIHCHSCMLFIWNALVFVDT